MPHTSEPFEKYFENFFDRDRYFCLQALRLCFKCISIILNRHSGFYGEIHSSALGLAVQCVICMAVCRQSHRCRRSKQFLL